MAKGLQRTFAAFLHSFRSASSVSGAVKLADPELRYLLYDGF